MSESRGSNSNDNNGKDKKDKKGVKETTTQDFFKGTEKRRDAMNKSAGDKKEDALQYARASKNPRHKPRRAGIIDGIHQGASEADIARLTDFFAQQKIANTDENKDTTNTNASGNDNGNDNTSSDQSSTPKKGSG